MARPTNKQQIEEISADNFEKMFVLIHDMSEEEQNQIFPFEDRDKNIRDVLVHLYEWHQLLLKWVKSNQAGEKATFLPEPYNWKTYPQMNIKFWEKHQNTPFDDAVKMVRQSHKDVMAVIDTFSDEELMTKKYYPWTGTTSLGSYCISATSSHYDWAIKKIKKYKKSL
ncbi:MAG: ClbS/DfsB family four-helix bundle protein [Alphaproteobacteria bacterium]